jgi:hypothetical protein
MCPIIPEQEAEFPAGVYLAEVRKCEQKTSKSSGAEMFEVTWGMVGFDGRLCIDRITFSKNAAGITGAKLGVLGFEVKSNVTPIELLGKRAYLNIVHEDFNGAPQCKVGMTFEDGCRGGYWGEDDLPPQITPVNPLALDPNDVPF